MLDWLTNALVVALCTCIEAIGGLRALVPCLRKLQPALNRAYFSAPTDKAVLTIDDAPGSVPHMHEVLDALRDRGHHATFFIISSFVTPDRAQLLERMVREGHELGNHMVKDERTTSYTPAQFEAALFECERTIQQFQAASKNKWYRPPSGMIAAWQLPILEHHGYRIILADVYPMDVQLTPARYSWIAGFVTSAIRPGSIVVLHSPDTAHKARGGLLAPCLRVLEKTPLPLVSLSEAFAA
jgi:peptidoglycan/xylan/chitin deacetylase (PgdA/CDA1 family)